MHARRKEFVFEGEPFVRWPLHIIGVKSLYIGRIVESKLDEKRMKVSETMIIFRKITGYIIIVPSQKTRE